MSTPLPPTRFYHVGPHGYYDLVRLARRGRTVLVRVIYVLALFAALAVVYYSDANERALNSRRRFDPPDRVAARQEAANRNARIAERFCITILVMQNLAVCLLMPIYVAASIQEDRDTNTLPLLFTTQLTAGQIVLGKLVSRIGQVGGVLLAGLPILACVQLWGGIDMSMIAANFANTGMLVLSVGAVSMAAAVHWRTFFRSLAITYTFLGLAALASFCCSLPLELFGPIRFLERNPMLLTPYGTNGDGYAEMQLAVAALALLHMGLAFVFLRFSAVPNLHAQRAEEMPERHKAPLPGISRTRNRWRGFPPIPEDVIAWKERYLDASLWIATPLGFLPLVVLWLWLFFVSTTSASPDARDGRHIVEAFCSLGVFVMLSTAGIYILLVSFRLAGCVVRERQQQTLEALLVLPMTRREILWSKIKGNLLRFWTWLLPFGATLVSLATFAPTGINRCGLVLALPAHLAFFAMLGFFLSVICRTTVSAYMSLGLVYFILLIGTAFMPLVLPHPIGTYLAQGVNPVGYWLTLCGYHRSFWTLELAPNILFCSIGAVVLWKLTCRQFARNPCGS